MNKLIAFIAFSLIVSISFAQVQRQKREKVKPDSTTTSMAQKADGGQSKRAMMKELDLTKEQKAKLKEFRQSAKEKKDAIENDNSLKADEKEAKLKELRKEQLKNIMGVLTPEQKSKLLQMRKENKNSKMDEIETQ